MQRFERKFTVLPRNIGFAYAMLRQVCRPDREYPQDRVHSLYFDNVDLEQYERSAAGDFRKDKVRIRWYGDITDGQGEIPVYVERKIREGFASSKQRQQFMVPAPSLEPGNLSGGILSKTELMETLAGFGLFPEKPLKPIIVISYQRHRFNEMQTGVRVSFDYDICASVVAWELGRRDRELRLRGGVIEVKGPRLELPVTLRRMKLLDADWSRFSKYGYCLEAHFTEPGSVARFSPSGRMVEL
ncbi:MAG: VTC domain-containing protein [Dehalococcoidales bacterium]|nr:VTC domain-containing protein [Dehalococcoidales bacterium]